MYLNCYGYSLSLSYEEVVTFSLFQKQGMGHPLMSFIFNWHFEILHLIVEFLELWYLSLILDVGCFFNCLNLVLANLIRFHELLRLMVRMNLNYFTSQMKSCLYFVQHCLQHYFRQNFATKSYSSESLEDWNYYFVLDFSNVNSYFLTLKN